MIVESGTLSVYHAPGCERVDYGPGPPNGSTLVEGGHDSHMVRNNGTVTAEVYVVSIIPGRLRPANRRAEPEPGRLPQLALEHGARLR